MSFISGYHTAMEGDRVCDKRFRDAIPEYGLTSSWPYRDLSLSVESYHQTLYRLSFTGWKSRLRVILIHTSRAFFEPNSWRSSPPKSETIEKVLGREGYQSILVPSLFAFLVFMTPLTDANDSDTNTLGGILGHGTATALAYTLRR